VADDDDVDKRTDRRQPYQ